MIIVRYFVNRAPGVKRMASATPDLRLPSQPQKVIACLPLLQRRRQSPASRGRKMSFRGGAHGERQTRDTEGVEFEAPRVETPGGEWERGIPLPSRLGEGVCGIKRRKLPQRGPGRAAPRRWRRRCGTAW